MNARQSSAVVERELHPIDENNIHGVTFDGKYVWFARNDELVAYDPEQEKVVRRLAVPGAAGGTAFDGENLYQLAKGEILVVSPNDGRVIRRIPAPTHGSNSGMAWADGYLWIGQYRESKIHKVDAQSGEIVKTIHSDRFVTGVSCVDGALWHATSGDGKAPEIRRVGADGSVEETVSVPAPFISGMEATADGTFWCGGESGKLRRVRRQA